MHREVEMEVTLKFNWVVSEESSELMYGCALDALSDDAVRAVELDMDQLTQTIAESDYDIDKSLIKVKVSDLRES